MELKLKKEDYMLRKVKVLQGRAREEADKQGLKDEDLVILKTTIFKHRPPKYNMKKVEGDPLKFLFDLGKN